MKSDYSPTIHKQTLETQGYEYVPFDQSNNILQDGPYANIFSPTTIHANALQERVVLHDEGTQKIMKTTKIGSEEDKCEEKVINNPPSPMPEQIIIQIDDSMAMES